MRHYGQARGRPLWAAEPPAATSVPMGVNDPLQSVAPLHTGHSSNAEPDTQNAVGMHQAR